MEKGKKEFWLNFYHKGKSRTGFDGSGQEICISEAAMAASVFMTRELADKAGELRVACVRVIFEEGEGLEKANNKTEKGS